MALPKSHRLKRRREFDQVYRQGRRYPDRHLLVRVSPVPPALDRQSMPLPSSASQARAALDPLAMPSRIAVVVSTKVSKRAVVRNLVRRRIQAALTQLLRCFKPGYWVVITVKPVAVECAYPDLLRELKQLLTKAEVLHGY